MNGTFLGSHDSFLLHLLRIAEFFYLTNSLLDTIIINSSSTEDSLYITSD